MESQTDTVCTAGHLCECGKSFSKRSDLKRHMSTHTGERNYKCIYCGKCFSQKSNLARHTVTHTGEGKFHCTVCEKGFSHNSDLNRHMAVHTGNWTFKCQVCGKGFSKKSDFHRHMTIHTGEKRHKCSVCGKGVSQKSDLSRHMAVHTGEKKYKCEYCGKLFSQKPNLNTHLNLHLRDTTLKCAVCGRNFSNKHTLTVHLATHAGRGNFQCSVCGKHMEMELRSSAFANVENFICTACWKGDILSSEEESGKSDEPLDSSVEERGGRCSVEMPSDENDDDEEDDDDDYDNNDGDDNVSVNDLLEVQLHEDQVETAVVVDDARSASDDQSKTEDEILGLKSEYDEVSAVDPLSTETDYIDPSTCVFINEKPLDTDVDDTNVGKHINDIKKECDDDLEKEACGTIVKEENLEYY